MMCSPKLALGENLGQNPTDSKLTLTARDFESAGQDWPLQMEAERDDWSDSKATTNHNAWRGTQGLERLGPGSSLALFCWKAENEVVACIVQPNGEKPSITTSVL